MAKMFEIMSVVLFLVSFFPYAWEIMKKRIHPVMATWGVFALLDAISLLALWKSGAVTPLAVLALLSSTGVVLLSLIYGKKGWSYVDLICFILAVVAILAWQLMQDPFYGLCISQAAILVAAVPTFASVYRNPANESLLAWGINLLSGSALIFALFLRDARGIELWLQPYVFFLIQATIVVLILRGPEKT